MILNILKKQDIFFSDQTVYYFYMRELHGIVWPSECPIACSTIIIYICSLLWHFWLDGGFFNCLQCNAALFASSIKLLMYLLFKSRHTFPGCFVNSFESVLGLLERVFTNRHENISFSRSPTWKRKMLLSQLKSLIDHF